MKIQYSHWKKLFLFCAGLAIAAAFCMKWMEPDLWAGNEAFSIIGLEFSYSKEELIAIMSSIDARVRTVLSYHLYFDFVFMAGIFPGIASLCMMAAHRVSGKSLAVILMILAALQTIAWLCDILENNWLLKWMGQPPSDTEFVTYHVVVYAKWLIALTGVLVAVISIAFFRRKKSKSYFRF